MPIYEYGCQKCGRQMEVVQKISDKPLARCPSCRGKLTRLLSASALQFKGTGWYVTDYAKKGRDGDKKDGEKKDGEKKDSDKKGSDKKDGEKAVEKKKESGSKATASAAKD